MQRIKNATELRRIFRILVGSLNSDLAFAARLARDPVGTLREHGYDLSGEAESVLRRAIPE